MRVLNTGMTMARKGNASDFGDLKNWRRATIPNNCAYFKARIPTSEPDHPYLKPFSTPSIEKTELIPNIYWTVLSSTIRIGSFSSGVTSFMRSCAIFIKSPSFSNNCSRFILSRFSC